METFCILIAALSTVLWVGFALLPWGLWRNREVLEAAPTAADAPLAQITAVIPARNEAELIQQTIPRVAAQGTDLKIILIDDGSDDGTAAVARQPPIQLLPAGGKPSPPCWSEVSIMSVPSISFLLIGYMPVWP